MIDEPAEPDEPEMSSSRLTPQEVDLEIPKLLASAADWRRLRSIATMMSAGVVGLTGEDLLQETLTRFYEGRKRWPREIHPVVVVKNAMRSVASDTRKRQDLGPVDVTVELATGGSEDDALDFRPKVHGSVAITPEVELSGKEQLAAVYAAVVGDEDLELLVMAWADGLRGDEAAQELGWDKKKYEAARKRLVRRLATLDADRRQK